MTQILLHVAIARWEPGVYLDPAVEVRETAPCLREIQLLWVCQRAYLGRLKAQRKFDEDFSFKHACLIASQRKLGPQVRVTLASLAASLTPAAMQQASSHLKAAPGAWLSEAA
jgi:hypothetical protein